MKEIKNVIEGFVIEIAAIGIFIALLFAVNIIIVMR